PKTGRWGFESLLPCSNPSRTRLEPYATHEPTNATSTDRTRRHLVNRQTKRLMQRQGMDRPRAPERRPQPTQTVPGRERVGVRQDLSEAKAGANKAAWPTGGDV